MLCKTYLGLSAAVAATIAAGTAFSAEPEFYHVVGIDIPGFSPLLPIENQISIGDLDNAGNLVGTYSTEEGIQSFLWTSDDGTQEFSVLLENPTSSKASDINNAWQVVGSVNNGSNDNAYIWGPTNGLQLLGGLPGYTYSHATALNDAGTAVGTSATVRGGEAEGFTIVSQAFIWDPTNGMRALGDLPGGESSTAADINDAGQVVGTSGNGIFGDPANLAFIWDETNGMQSLGVSSFRHGSSTAVAINNTGRVIVNQTVALGQPRGTPPTAYIWDKTNGIQELDQEYSKVHDINNLSQVVGTFHAAGVGIWDEVNGARSLNTLIGSSEWTIRAAHSINDAGVIAGFGINPDGDLQAFLLIPGVNPCPHEEENLCPTDLNGDGTVDIQDLQSVLDNWGPCDPGN